MAPRYLADTSALGRMRRPAVERVLAPLIMAGDVATCGIVDLELLWSARDPRELAAIRAERAQSFPAVPTEEVDFDRAADVMETLALAGRHRAASIPDLLLAAIAERNGLTILHYDRDFEFIAAVTGQPAEWVVPRGSVP